MKSYVSQYKLFFFLSWIVFYLIFPSWALPVSTTTRAFIFFGLLIYFTTSLYLMNRWFNAVLVDKPFIIPPQNIAVHIKNNSWLFIICCIAVVLHVYPISRPILMRGDEALHLQGGVLIYDYIDVRWHKVFQIVVWMLFVLGLLLIRVKNADNIILNKLKNLSGGKAIYLSGFIVIIFFLIAYFLLLKNIPYTLLLIRYPPVSKFLYFIVYSAFGINYIFARIIQLIFYLLCAVYLYRTINLVYDKETALLGATTYLFLPVTFSYAHLGEIESGAIFFIVVISFYFLRYLKERDNRDLLLAVYLIGIGYLYKDPVFLVFPVCFVLLIIRSIKKHNLYPLLHIKILLLAAMPVIPWMIIQKLYSWRHYTFQMSNLTSLDSKIITYFPLIASNVSSVIFVLFFLSVIYACFIKRNMLTIYFGFLFIVCYFFIVSDMGALSPRFSMALYPTISIFLSLFISGVMKNIRWRHILKLCFIVLTTYLIIISSNKRFLNFESRKHQYYPSENAMEWVKENIKDGEKILLMRIMPADFYRVKFKIDKSRIVNFMYELMEVSTPERLKAFYRENNLSYIMFPYGPGYPLEGERKILKYLKENQNNEFIEVAKFNLNENFIYIYKVKVLKKF